MPRVPRAPGPATPAVRARAGESPFRAGRAPWRSAVTPTCWRSERTPSGCRSRRRPHRIGCGSWASISPPARSPAGRIAARARCACASERAPSGSRTGDLAIDGRTLWISAPEEGSVIRLDARSGRAVGEPIRVGGEPLDIEALDGDVWVDLGEADALAHIHGRSGRLLGRTPSVGGVFAIALGFGSVWATNYERDTVTRLDAATGRRVGRPIRTGPDPKGVVAGAGAVWVANAGACAVTRIEPGGTPVGFRTRDGVRLEGKLWGDGPVGIVFSHMGGAGDDQADWYPLARTLAA